MKTVITLTFILLISGCAGKPQPLASQADIKRLVNAFDAYCFNQAADNQNIQLLAHANRLNTVSYSDKPELSALHRTLNIRGIPWTHQPVVYRLTEKASQQPAVFLSTFLPDTCIVSMKMNPKSVYDLIMYLERNYGALMRHSTRRGDLLVKVFNKAEKYAQLIQAKKNNEEIKDTDKIIFTFSYLYDQQTIGLTYIPFSTALELFLVQLKGKLGTQQSSTDHPVKSIMYKLNEKNPPDGGL